MGVRAQLRGDHQGVGRLVEPHRTPQRRVDGARVRWRWQCEAEPPRREVGSQRKSGQGDDRGEGLFEQEPSHLRVGRRVGQVRAQNE
jgi:hypothetical protein